MSKCFKIIKNFIWKHKVTAIDAQMSNCLMKYFHKAWNKIKEIKWELQYSDITYRTLLYLIKSASTSIDHFTNFMSYNNEFCLYLPLIINIQKDMSFRNRKILCTLHNVIFFSDWGSNKPVKEKEKEEIWIVCLHVPK